MRETLFKAKRKDTDEWVEGSLLGSDVIVPKGVEFYVDEGYLDGLDGTRVYIVDPKTICQYTGVKARDRKKVFEGDIVTAKVIQNGGRKYTEKYEVAYHPEYCYYYLKKYRNNLLFDGNWSYGVSIQEVIGNVFDNIELLEAEG